MSYSTQKRAMTLAAEDAMFAKAHRTDRENFVKTALGFYYERLWEMNPAVLPEGHSSMAIRKFGELYDALNAAA